MKVSIFYLIAAVLISTQLLADQPASPPKPPSNESIFRPKPKGPADLQLAPGLPPVPPSAQANNIGPQSDSQMGIGIQLGSGNNHQPKNEPSDKLQRK